MVGGLDEGRQRVPTERPRRADDLVRDAGRGTDHRAQVACDRRASVGLLKEGGKDQIIELLQDSPVSAADASCGRKPERLSSFSVLVFRRRGTSCGGRQRSRKCGRRWCRARCGHRVRRLLRQRAIGPSQGDDGQPDGSGGLVCLMALRARADGCANTRAILTPNLMSDHFRRRTRIGAV